MTTQEKHRVEEAYRGEKSRLLGFIKSRIPDDTEAEDLLQDVFLRLILNSTGIQTIENLTAWIYTVTRNRIVDFFRKSRTESLEEQSIPTDSDESPLNLEDLLPDLGNSPEDKILSDLISYELQEALEDMPSEQREVFVLHEFEGKNFKDIEKQKEVSQNTVLSRKRYAILFLRKRLQSLYDQINE